MYNLINRLNNTAVQFNTLEALFKYIIRVNEAVCFTPQYNAIEYRGVSLNSRMLYNMAIKYLEQMEA